MAKLIAGGYYTLKVWPVNDADKKKVDSKIYVSQIIRLHLFV